MNRILLSAVGLYFNVHTWYFFVTMSNDDIDNAILSNQKKAKQHILFGNILLLQITLMLGKVVPRMQCACFVTKASVDAAPPGQITSSFMRSFFYFNVADSSSFA